MRKSAKIPTDTSRGSRSDLKRQALAHFREGGFPASFARERGIPRSTVIGWQAKWEKSREITTTGRPTKLAIFNEDSVLREMVATKGIQDWRSVKALIHKMAGCNMSRRSVFRLLVRWGVILRGWEPGAGALIVVGEWSQPTETVDSTVHRTGSGAFSQIWRFVFRGGMDGFMFTKDDSESSLTTIVSALKGYQIKRKKRLLRTAHKFLAERIRQECPDWSIEVVEPSTAKSEFSWMLGPKRGQERLLEGPQGSHPVESAQ